MEWTSRHDFRSYFWFAEPGLFPNKETARYGVHFEEVFKSFFQVIIGDSIRKLSLLMSQTRNLNGLDSIKLIFGVVSKM